MKKPEILSYICPRCGYDGGGGVVHKMVYMPTLQILYVCDECGTTWEENGDLAIPTTLYIEEFLENNGQKGNYSLLKKYYLETLHPSFGKPSLA